MLVLELTKDGKVFGYADYKELVGRLINNPNGRVRFSRSKPIMDYLTLNNIEIESLEVTIDDILLKKYREIDVSLERLKELKSIWSIITSSMDFDLLDSIHAQIVEIKRIRFELGIDD